MKTKNHLSLWIAEYIRHQPEAGPAQAWEHLTEIATQHGVFPWLIGKDEATGDLLYRLNLSEPARRIKRLSFSRQFQRARVLAGFA